MDIHETKCSSPLFFLSSTLLLKPEHTHDDRAHTHTHTHPPLCSNARTMHTCSVICSSSVNNSVNVNDSVLMRELGGISPAIFTHAGLPGQVEGYRVRGASVVHGSVVTRPANKALMCTFKVPSRRSVFQCVAAWCNVVQCSTLCCSKYSALSPTQSANTVRCHIHETCVGCLLC